MNKEIPILMSQPMVRALQQGIKTQTRRGRNLATINKAPGEWYFVGIEFVPSIRTNFFIFKNVLTGLTERIKCPYGIKGDILWVRETFSETVDTLQQKVIAYKTGAPMYVGGNDGNEHLTHECTNPVVSGKWKPGIHIKKWQTRMCLRVKNIWVERLSNISYADLVCEGIGLEANGEFPVFGTIGPVTTKDAVYSYMSLWDEINGKDSHKKDEWVWVIEFEIIK